MSSGSQKYYDDFGNPFWLVPISAGLGWEVGLILLIIVGSVATIGLAFLPYWLTYKLGRHGWKNISIWIKLGLLLVFYLGLINLGIAVIFGYIYISANPSTEALIGALVIIVAGFIGAGLAWAPYVLGRYRRKQLNLSRSSES